LFTPVLHGARRGNAVKLYEQMPELQACAAHVLFARLEQEVPSGWLVTAQLPSLAQLATWHSASKEVALQFEPVLIGKTKQAPLVEQAGTPHCIE
jgi:hypothetical protein